MRLHLAGFDLRRTVLIVLSIGVGASASLFVPILNASVASPFATFSQALRSAAPEASVLQPRDGYWMDESTLREVPEDWDPAPAVLTAISVSKGDTTEGALLVGGDCRLAAAANMRSCPNLDADTLAVGGGGLNPLSVALSEPLARSIGADRGDVISLPGGRSARVADVLATGPVPTQLEHEHVVYADVMTAQDLAGRPGQLSVLVLPGGGRISGSIVDSSGNTFEVTTPHALPLPPALARAQLLFGVVGLAVVAAGCFLAISACLIGSTERRRSLAIAAALGESRARLAAGYVLEGALMGLLGIPIALGLGIAAGSVLVRSFGQELLTGTGMDIATVIPTGWVLVASVTCVLLGAVAAAVTLPDVVAASPTSVLTVTRPFSGAGRIRPWMTVVPLAGLAIAIVCALGAGRGWLPQALAYGASGIGTCSLILLVVLLAPVVIERAPRWRARWVYPLQTLVQSDLSFTPIRTGVTTAIVAFGVMLVVAVQGTKAAVTAEFEEGVPLALGNSAIVLPSQPGAILSLSLSDSLVESIRSVPGVEGVSRGGSTLLSGQLGVTGIDAESPIIRGGFTSDSAVERSNAEAIRGGEVLITAVAAEMMGTGAGELVTLPTLHGPQAFRVAAVGHLRGGEASSLAATILVDYDRATVAWGLTPGGVLVQPSDGDVPGLLARLPDSGGVFLYDSASVTAATIQVMNRYMKPFVAVGWLALLVSGFGIVTCLWLARIDRARDRAALRSIGMSPGFEMATIVGDAMVLGGLGVLLGIPAGLMFEWIFVLVGPVMFANQPQFTIPWAAVWPPAVAALLVALTGAVLPALRIRRVEFGVLGGE